VEGRGALALTNIRKAIALLETTEDSLNLARAHVLAARLLVEREKADEAADHLGRADLLLGVQAAASDVAEITILRSRIAHIRGDAVAAIELAREALGVESDPADHGYALAALADGLTLSGETGDADAAYRNAVQILEDEGRWRDAANTARAWGGFLRAAGRGAEAMDALDRAAELGMRATPQHARTER
jgi:tetratricopeptide (TPR) repeat protein